MAQLNGKTYHDWEEYIHEKFSEEVFDISEELDATSTRIITVSRRDNSSQTRIVFDFPTAGLCRTCFYHPNSPLLNSDNDKERQRSLMYADYEISDENLGNINDYLNIPLYYGWTERAIYYKNKVIKSEIVYFDGIFWQNILLEKKLSWFDKVGCLTILLAWPVLVIQRKLVRHRLDTSNKHTSIMETHILPMLTK